MKNKDRRNKQGNEDLSERLMPRNQEDQNKLAINQSLKQMILQHCNQNDSCSTSKEMVNHPSHYQSKSGLEVIDVIEAFDLGFALGNAVKYILRCGKKDSEIQELEKAKWYIEREIANRKAK